MTFLWTALAMAAFAANSVLCRLALRSGEIDANTFSTVRIGSGAVVLVSLALLRPRSGYRIRADWLSSLALGLYVVPFSYAYLDLSAGTGALILFGSVQLTMLLWAIRCGERLGPSQWAGWLSSGVGLAVLLLPGQSAPPLSAAGLMALSGIAWGVYSLRGRGSKTPLENTANNFLFCAPALLALYVLQLDSARAETRGLVLAVASGALASGVGYAIWYSALRGLSSTAAAIVQLSVPILAALYGIAFMGEAWTGRLVAATALVLGGVWIALLRVGERSAEHR